jgi:hypothetical protein
MAQRGQADAAVNADRSSNSRRHDGQNGPLDPSTPQSEHDQGNTKASTAWPKPLSQPAMTPRSRAAMGRENLWPSRKERKEIIVR